MTAQAQAQALEMISAQLNKTGGEEAARLALARDYVAMYSEMGRESNTIMFNERPADANALIAQAMMSMTAATNAMKGPTVEVGTKASLAEGSTPKLLDSESEEKKVDQ